MIPRHGRDPKELHNSQGRLTAGELCRRSGLRPGGLADLQTAGLLRPDYRGGLFRAKQLTWATKLARLLADGWTVPEIKEWTRTRWNTPDPQWPAGR